MVPRGGGVVSFRFPRSLHSGQLFFPEVRVGFPVLFAVYWLSVLAWCLLAERLCASLSQRHPLLYESLGRPAPLAAGSGMQDAVSLLGFLLHRRDRSVDDPRLARLCGAMRGLLIAYSLFFLTAPAVLAR